MDLEIYTVVLYTLTRNVSDLPKKKMRDFFQEREERVESRRCADEMRRGVVWMWGAVR